MWRWSSPPPANGKNRNPAASGTSWRANCLDRASRMRANSCRAFSLLPNRRSVSARPQAAGMEFGSMRQSGVKGVVRGRKIRSARAPRDREPRRWRGFPCANRELEEIGPALSASSKLSGCRRRQPKHLVAIFHRKIFGEGRALLEQDGIAVLIFQAVGQQGSRRVIFQQCEIVGIDPRAGGEISQGRVIQHDRNRIVRRLVPSRVA